MRYVIFCSFSPFVNILLWWNKRLPKRKSRKLQNSNPSCKRFRYVFHHLILLRTRQLKQSLFLRFIIVSSTIYTINIGFPIPIVYTSIQIKDSNKRNKNKITTTNTFARELNKLKKIKTWPLDLSANTGVGKQFLTPYCVWKSFSFYLKLFF